MKTATVRDLRNHYAGLMEWIEAGEEIRITRRGIPIARLVPEPGGEEKQVQWEKSPAFQRARDASETISADDATRILHESAGKW